MKVSTEIKERFFWMGILVIGLILFRMLPHPPNFSPLIALSIFSRKLVKDRAWSWILPIGIMLGSDLFIGWHQTMLFVYGSLFAIAYLTPSKALGRISSTLFSAVGASLFFFLITNTGVWLTSGMYPMTVQGLAACFVAAIPFYHYSLVSTLLFSVAFYAFDLVVSYRTSGRVEEA